MNSTSGATSHQAEMSSKPSANAARAIGSMIRKIQRHPNWARMKPATTGPIAGATDMTIEMRPIMPGVSDGVMIEVTSGLKVGEKRDVKITFPADFAPVPALAGKRAPSFENVGRLMAFNIRLRQLFRRGRKEVA